MFWIPQKNQIDFQLKYCFLSFYFSKFIYKKCKKRLCPFFFFWQKLKVGFALDEGLASPAKTIPLFYGQRNGFYVNFKCSGPFEMFTSNVQVYFKCLLQMFRSFKMFTSNLNVNVQLIFLSTRTFTQDDQV